MPRTDWRITDMLNFLAENWGTLLVGATLVTVISLIIVKMRRDKKKGASSCGCGCDHCPSATVCHKK